MESRFSFCILLVVSLAVKNVNSVTTVNPETGGYSFTLAIDDSVPEPANAAALEAYTSNIRTSLQRFSNQLFISSQGAFHLENVQILLPGAWSSEVTSAIELATTESYSTSDIRLSTHNVPFVANPHPCGLPGHYVELPHTFLNGNYDDTYGPIDKVLLTQWARFRWGVWEEHGYPASGKFPYFYKPNPVNTQDWEATTCSDVSLEGEYRTVGSDEPCTTPAANCRFHPAWTNRATSSLMAFHWLETVTHFCDGTTHNKLAPNKQNLYCENKSVWDIIRSSPDFVEHDPIEAVPVAKVNVVKISNHPVLHLLLDRGFVYEQSHLVLVSTIIRELSTLFNFEGNDNMIASISEFGQFGQFGEIPFQTVVPWKKVNGNEDEFVEGLGEVLTDHPTFRDFSSALLQVVDSVESINPARGAVVLIVKTGGVETYYGSLESEEEVSAALSKAHIRLYAAEVFGRRASEEPELGELPFINLRTLTQRTGGIHHQFDNPQTATEQIHTIIDQIRDVVNSQPDPVPIQDTTQVLYKGKMVPAVSTTVLQPNGVSAVQIHITVPADGTEPILQIGGTPITGTSRNEWDEEHEPTRRVVYTFDVPASVQGNLEFQYTCASCHESTEARVVVTARPAATNPNTDVSVAIGTSAINNHVEFSATSQPFAIYATVLLNHRPVTNVVVQATITNSQGTEDIVELLDDGTGFPDIEGGDGIYSGMHVPLADGTYKISVKVETESETRHEASTRVSYNEHSRLLPIDQEEIDCPSGECDGVPLEDEYSNIFDIGDITFANVDSFPLGTPAKIFDLTALAIHGGDFNEVNLRFTFSSPRIVGVSDSNAKATRYFILGSDNFNDLESPTPGGDLVQNITTTSPPGLTETFETAILPGADEQLYSYYIVFSAYSNPPSHPVERIMRSNIVQRVDQGESTDPGTTTDGGGPGEEVTTPEPEDDDDDDKPFFKTAGGIVVIILIVLIIAGAIGGGAFYYMKKKRNSSKLMDSNERI